MAIDIFCFFFESRAQKTCKIGKINYVFFIQIDFNFSQNSDKKSSNENTNNFHAKNYNGSFNGIDLTIEPNKKPSIPIIINHIKTEISNKREDFVDNKPNSKSNTTSSVVKIINNNNVNTDLINSNPEATYNQSLKIKTNNNALYQITNQSTSDDHNNNQLKSSTSINNQVNQIARIHSNGSGTFPVPHPRGGNSNQLQLQLLIFKL